MKIKKIPFYHICVINMICLLAGLTTNTFGQRSEPERFLQISITLLDSNKSHLKFIEISIPKNEINSSLTPVNAFHFDLVNKINCFKIPLPAKISYVRILGLNEQKKPVSQLEYSRNLFLVADKDSLNIGFSNNSDSLSFSGKNSGKYTCEYKLNCNKGINNQSFNYYWSLNKFDCAFEALNKQRDSLNRFEETIIQKHVQYLTPADRQLLETDYLMNNSKMILAFCFMAYNSGLVNEYPAATRFYNKYFSQANPDKLENPILLNSYQYADYLLFKEKTGIIIYNTTPGKSFFNDFRFSFINVALNEHFSKGLLKDKLKLLAFYDVDHHQNDFADYLKEAVEEAQPGTIQNLLIEIRRINENGATIPSFNFPDQNGRMMDLTSLRGKLIVLDFWFTGCHGCLGMAKTLKPLIKQFKGNSKIIFVSLSIDRNINVWEHSLQSENYCSKDELNLFEGKNGKSKFVATYNIQEYPTLFLISKRGTLITSSVPDPRVDKKAFLKLIEDNL